MRLLLSAVQESAAGAAILTPDRNARGAWQELRNKVEAFRTFEHVDSLLGASVVDTPVGELAARAVSLGPPLSVWAAEGIGYHMTAVRCREREPPRRLLAPGGEWAVPPETLIPLHAGMGSAFASCLLDAVREYRTTAAIDDAVEQFEELCAANARDVFNGTAREALGFVTRGMYYELLPIVDARLQVARAGLCEVFWHGVGRAMYFSPMTALPFGDARVRVLTEVCASARRPADRRNAMAGVAWAATLVNLRNPEVLEPWVASVADSRDAEAFACGVHSALEAWGHCAPSDSAAAAFRRHVPRRPDCRDAWEGMMTGFAMPHARMPGDLFHCPDGRDGDE
jgi:hypothetical protein